MTTRDIPTLEVELSMARGLIVDLENDKEFLKSATREAQAQMLKALDRVDEAQERVRDATKGFAEAIDQRDDLARAFLMLYSGVEVAADIDHEELDAVKTLARRVLK